MAEINVGSAVAYLTLDASKYSSALKTAGQQLNAFMDSSQATGNRIESLGSALNAAGVAMSNGLTKPLGEMVVSVGSTVDSVGKLITGADEIGKAFSQAKNGVGALIGQMEMLLIANTEYTAASSGAAIAQLGVANSAKTVASGLGGIASAWLKTPFGMAAA